jgi:hypothetical protein
MRPVDSTARERLNRVWNQQDVPILLRRTGGEGLRMRLPYRPDNRAWIRNGRRSIPKWNAKAHYWDVPKAWFNKLVAECLDTFGSVYIIQPYREQEKCAPACWNATGDECQCSCMGEHHGMNNPAGHWRIISDTFATRWGEHAIACRLITRRT